MSSKSFKDWFFSTPLGKYRIKQYERKKRKEWRKKNPHNTTEMCKVFDENIVKVGNESYGDLNIVTFGGNSKLIIGNYVSIAQEVHFILDAEHYTNHISTYPFKVKIIKSQEYEAFSKGDIIVDDDVWIGYGVTILSGVHIGQGAVIAAGSVVTKDVPPYAIFGGVPARLKKYRFENDIVEFLNSLDFEKLEKNIVLNHLDDLYKDIQKKSLDEIKNTFDWMPRK